LTKMVKVYSLNKSDQKSESLKIVREILDQWSEKIAEVPLGELIDFLLDYIVSNDSVEILPLLQESKAAKSLQPLIVALQEELGQKVRVSVEVKEVAADIRKELAELRKRKK